MRNDAAGPLSFPQQMQVALEHLQAAQNSLLEGLIRSASPASIKLNLPPMISPAPSDQQKFSPFQLELELTQKQAQTLSDEYGGLLDPKSRTGTTFYLIYGNDGRGVNPGRGSDQGRTAYLAFGWDMKTNKGDPTSPEHHIRITAIDMYTPKALGTPPREPGVEPRDTTYATGPRHPYSGVASVEFGITTYADGGWRIDRLVAIGVDVPALGKVLQDGVHDYLSNSPHFQWQERKIKPLFEAGVHATRQSRTLKFDSLSLTGRMEVSGGFLAGSRRTEADLSCKYIVEQAHLRGPDAVYWEMSLGALARGFVRYNDGRPSADVGVEAGFIGELAAHFGKRTTVRVQYTDIQSTDPAYQTRNTADELALGQEIAPVSASTGKGGHGIGFVKLELHFE
jgi:hypothetical protein